MFTWRVRHQLLGQAGVTPLLHKEGCPEATGWFGQGPTTPPAAQAPLLGQEGSVCFFLPASHEAGWRAPRAGAVWCWRLTPE